MTKYVLAAAIACSLCPLTAHAQNNVPAAAQQAESDVERTVKRFGMGVEGGVALNPDLIDVGVHGTFGPIVTRAIQFRPEFEVGIGELTTLFGHTVH